MMNAKAQPRERGIPFNAEMVEAILAGEKTQTRRPLKPQPDTPDGGQWRFSIGASDKALLRRPWSYSVPDPDGETFDLPRTRETARLQCPYGNAGDRLWVRESWATGVALDPSSPSAIEAACSDAGWKQCWAPVRYAADGAELGREELKAFGGAWGRARAAFHMPRWASRITLEITEVIVQRVLSITEEGAVAEGCRPYIVPSHYQCLSKCGHTWSQNDEPSEANSPWPLHSFVKTEPRELMPARSGFLGLWVRINGEGSLRTNPWVWVITFKVAEKVRHG